MTPGLPIGYDPVIADRLCFLSDLAYDCFRKDKLNPAGAVCHENFAFIVRLEDNKILIGVQGSNDRKDWLGNARFIIRSPEYDRADPFVHVGFHPFPPVHTGFWHGAKTLLKPLLDALSMMPNRPIYFGGHSLGHALSVILALLLIEHGHSIGGVYGFGGAPAGAVKLYNYYSRFNIPTFLLVYMRDGIPFLQPKGVHMAPLTFLDERAYVLPKRPGFSLWRFWKWSAWRDDHDSQNYLAAARKIKDRAVTP